jgi:hypothetical protein
MKKYPKKLKFPLDYKTTTLKIKKNHRKFIRKHRIFNIFQANLLNFRSLWNSRGFPEF